MVLLPIKTLQRRISGNTRVNTLLVSMKEGSNAERVKASLTQLLRERRKLADSDEDNFNVLDTKQLADTLSGTTKVMTMLLGGLIGIVLATGASIGLSRLMQVPYLFNPTVNIVSFVFSAGIGVLFGYFPARRAARMDPIEALRHE